MKYQISLLMIASAVLVGCGTVRMVPPADIPAQPLQTTADPGWRPYSSGPMQAATPGIRSGPKNSWGGGDVHRSTEAVTRAALPDVKSGTAEAVTTVPVAEVVADVPVAAPAAGAEGWKPYAARRTGRVPSVGPSVFGRGVSSSWARDYVPESLRIEFGIFAVKAATDGQARMVTPTGQVYAASVVRRNGPCSTLEIGVTEGGDLPIVARGPVEVCR